MRFETVNLGIPGPQGETGAPGPTGPEGPQGIQGETGIAASSVHYNNVPAGEGAEIDPAINTIELLNYTTSVDGGGATYKRVVAEPAHAGKFQSLDGAWWEIAEDQLYADMFGAIRGEGHDAVIDAVFLDNNRAAIQAMIDAIHLYGYSGTPNLRTGVYEYTGTLHVGRGDTVKTLALIGQGRAYRALTGSNAGTTLRHMGPITSQAINVQGARYARLQGFTLQGMLNAAIETFFTTTYLTDLSPLVNTAIWTALGGDNRYAPYAGITLDAFAGSTPPTSYPGATYGKGSSTSLEMRDLEIAGFNTGFVNVPAATNAQGDFTSMYECRIENCMYAFSVGNTQSRNIDINGFNYLQCHTVFTNNKHGMQDGRYGGIIRQCSGGRAVWLFDFNAGRTFAGVVFEAFYAEIQFALGKCGAGSGGQGVAFRGGLISFLDPSRDYGSAAWIVEGTTTCPVLFEDFSFSNYKTTLHFQPRNIKFVNGCLIQSLFAIAATDAVNLYKSFAHNATAGGVVLDPFNGIRGDQEIQFSPRNVDTGVAGAIQLTNSPSFTVTNRINCCPIHVSRPGISPAVSYKRSIERPRSYSTLAKTGFSPITLVGATLTLGIASTTYMAALRDGYFPGDVIRDAGSGSVFWIRSYSGPAAGAAAGAATLLAELQNNMKPDGTLYNTFDTAVGNLEFINSRMYAQSDVTVGDTSTTTLTDTIQNVGNEAGSWSFGTVLAGDGLPVSAQRGLFTSTNRVLAVNTGARTIQMSSAALRTAVREDFTWWVRSGAPNV